LSSVVGYPDRSQNPSSYGTPDGSYVAPGGNNFGSQQGNTGNFGGRGTGYPSSTGDIFYVLFTTNSN